MTASPTSEADTAATPLPPRRPETLQAVSLISIEKISPNPHQPRRQFSELKLAELAASIKLHGMLQPIIVRAEGDSYQLVAGERRFRAAKMANLASIPALVKNIGDVPQAELALIENIHRENLNPIERAMGYRMLLNQGFTQDDLAYRLGEDRSVIANHVRLLTLHQAVQDMIADGRLTMGHAKVLAGLTDLLAQVRHAERAVQEGQTVRALEKAIAETPAASPLPTAKGPQLSAHIQSMEKSISGQLGMRVQLRTNGKTKGRVVIHYASLDQFDELMARMNVKTDD